jgi:hypothetical protein
MGYALTAPLARGGEMVRPERRVLRNKLHALFTVAGVEATDELVTAYGKALIGHVGPALWDAIDKAICSGAPLWSPARILDAAGVVAPLCETAEHRAVNSWAAVAKQRTLGYERCWEWLLTDFERQLIGESFGGIKGLCFAESDEILRAQYVRHYQHREAAKKREMAAKGASPQELADVFNVRRTRAEYEALHPAPSEVQPPKAIEPPRMAFEEMKALTRQLLASLDRGASSRASSPLADRAVSK